MSYWGKHLTKGEKWTTAAIFTLFLKTPIDSVWAQMVGVFGGGGKFGHIFSKTSIGSFKLYSLGK